jgi:hypothetical protein
MDSGDLSTKPVLSSQILDDLAPASAVRAVEARAAKQDAPGIARRRRAKEEAETAGKAEKEENADQPAHQFDQLA